MIILLNHLATHDKQHTIIMEEKNNSSLNIKRIILYDVKYPAVLIDFIVISKLLLNLIKKWGFQLDLGIKMLKIIWEIFEQKYYTDLYLGLACKYIRAKQQV